MNARPKSGVWRPIAVWASYDWANSAFPTCVVTFIYATYFTQAIAEDELSGTAAWSRAVAVSSILAALLSPLAGAMADRGGRRAEFLIAATFICCAATALLTFVSPGLESAVLLALVLFAIANLAFEMGTVFYNGFLPELAPKGAIGRASGWSWGFGYAGGLTCLALALPMALAPEQLGIGTEEGFNFRAVNLLVALWFAVFSVPMLRLALRLRPPVRPRVPPPAGVPGRGRHHARSASILRSGQAAPGETHLQRWSGDGVRLRRDLRRGHLRNELDRGHHFRHRHQRDGGCGRARLRNRG